MEVIYSGGAHDQNQFYQEEPKEEPLPGDQNELIESRLVNKPKEEEVPKEEEAKMITVWKCEKCHKMNLLENGNICVNLSCKFDL